MRCVYISQLVVIAIMMGFVFYNAIAHPELNIFVFIVPMFILILLFLIIVGELFDSMDYSSNPQW